MAGTMNTGPAGEQVTTQDQAAAILAAQAVSIGRFQSPEQWFNTTQAMATPSSLNIPRPMPLNRPAESIVIQLALRITVANNNMTLVAPEAPQSILQLVLLNGTHTKWANLTPIRASGATLFGWLYNFQGHGCTCIINGVRATGPNVPFVSPFLGNVGTYDVLLTYNIPLGPTYGIGQSAKRDLSTFLYQPTAWGDSLQLQLNFGDASALGTPTTAGDVTLSAFGSAGGSPQVTVFVNYSILGTFANSIDSGIVIRQEQLFNSFVTAGNTLRISQLQKQITENLIIKAGTQLAGTTAGVQVFGTLVDNQLDRTQIVVDNKPVKFNQNNQVMKAYLDRMFAVPMPGGYFNLSFVDGQNAMLSYRGDGLAGGSLFELQSDVLTTGATQIIAMTQEMIYGGPFPPLRPL